MLKDIKVCIRHANATVEDGYKIILKMAVQILPAASLYWNLAERFMGDTEVPVCLFLLFPEAHTYCISVTVAQQQRDNMSQHTWIWHRREKLVSGCHVVTAYPVCNKKGVFISTGWCMSKSPTNASKAHP